MNITTFSHARIKQLALLGLLEAGIALSLALAGLGIAAFYIVMAVAAPLDLALMGRKERRAPSRAERSQAKKPHTYM
ncbi:MAG TPA: hypothetical protein VED41_10475 [Solirubrobacteraceae bacterium]|nr:hypothetical protein [Solirubrobacteraceae bacterium]